MPFQDPGVPKPLSPRRTPMKAGSQLDLASQGQRGSDDPGYRTRLVGTRRAESKLLPERPGAIGDHRNPLQELDQRAEVVDHALLVQRIVASDRFAARDSE